MSLRHLRSNQASADGTVPAKDGSKIERASAKVVERRHIAIAVSSYGLVIRHCLIVSVACMSLLPRAVDMRVISQRLASLRELTSSCAGVHGTVLAKHYD